MPQTVESATKQNKPDSTARDVSKTGEGSEFPWTGNPTADRLLAEEPLALLIGMLLDQQFPMERAFYGPFLLAERMGTTGLDASLIAEYDPEKMVGIFRGPPAIHRYPAAMAERTQQLCRAIVVEYQGDPTRIWREAQDGKDLRLRLCALPGYGLAKTRVFISIVGLRLGEGPPGWKQEAADWPSIAEITRFEDIADLRLKKRELKQQTAVQRTKEK